MSVIGQMVGGQLLTSQQLGNLGLRDFSGGRQILLLKSQFF